MLITNYYLLSEDTVIAVKTFYIEDSHYSLNTAHLFKVGFTLIKGPYKPRPPLCQFNFIL